jgi:hypothetical protein
MFTNKLNTYTNVVEKIGRLKLKAKPSEKFLQYTNANGETKRYKLANAEMEHNGKNIPIVVSIAEKTLISMAEGGAEFTPEESYLSTLTRVESRTEPGKYIVLARMSHLQGVTDHTALLEALADWTVEEVAVGAVAATT